MLLVAMSPRLPSFTELTAGLIPAAQAAGQAIMRLYAQGGNLTVYHKEDASPFTQADLAAEAILIAALRGLTPDIPIVAEESAPHGAADGRRDVFWLVDPLDGTKEFLNRTGEFTVNLALVQNRKPIFGLIQWPVTEQIYVTPAQNLAKRIDAPGRETILAMRPPPAEGYDILVSRSHADGRLADLLSGIAVRAVRSAGSSLKFCRLAEGTADLYIRTGPTSEWDTAAGHALLQAAGGQVCGLDGAPLVYAKDGYLNGGFQAFRAGQKPPISSNPCK